jgi:hypothetical protein
MFHARLDLNKDNKNDIGWRLFALRLIELTMDFAIKAAALAGTAYAFWLIYQQCIR